MQLLFIGVAVIGCISLTIGIKLSLSVFKIKTVTTTNLSEEIKKIDLGKGKYSISFIGGMHIENLQNFGVSILLDKKRVEVFEPYLKANFYYKGSFCKEFFNFDISDSGIYDVKFNNIEDFDMKVVNYRFIKNATPRMDANKISIIISERANKLKQGIAIFSSVIGAQALFAGSVLACNPQIYM